MYFLDPNNYSPHQYQVVCYLHDLKQCMFGATNGIIDPWPLRMSSSFLRQTNEDNPSKSLGTDQVNVCQTTALMPSEVLCLITIHFLHTPFAYVGGRGSRDKNQNQLMREFLLVWPPTNYIILRVKYGHAKSPGRPDKLSQV